MNMNIIDPMFGVAVPNGTTVEYGTLKVGDSKGDLVLMLSSNNGGSFFIVPLTHSVCVVLGAAIREAEIQNFD